MGWQIEFDQDVEKELRRIDQTAQKRILQYLRHRIANAADPRNFGKPLRGNLLGLWRYRVGDYRVICRLEDQKMVVLVVAIGHRKDIYD